MVKKNVINKVGTEGRREAKETLHLLLPSEMNLSPVGALHSKQSCLLMVLCTTTPKISHDFLKQFCLCKFGLKVSKKATANHGADAQGNLELSVVKKSLLQLSPAALPDLGNTVGMTKEEHSMKGSRGEVLLLH